jgi:hypothetical protein
MRNSLPLKSEFGTSLLIFSESDHTRIETESNGLRVLRRMIRGEAINLQHPRKRPILPSASDAVDSLLGCVQRTSAKPRFVAQWQRSILGQDAAGPSLNRMLQSATQVDPTLSRSAVQERFDAECSLALVALQGHLRFGVQFAQHRAYSLSHRPLHKMRTSYSEPGWFFHIRGRGVLGVLV